MLDSFIGKTDDREAAAVAQRLKQENREETLASKIAERPMEESVFTPEGGGVTISPDIPPPIESMRERRLRPGPDRSPQERAKIEGLSERSITRQDILQPGPDRSPQERATIEGPTRTPPQKGENVMRAETGKPWSGSTFRGKTEKPTDAGDYGKGRYSTGDVERAKAYGKVEDVKVTLKNPLVFDNNRRSERI